MLATLKSIPIKQLHILFNLLILLFVSACSTNPVTGKNELSLLGESWELNVGKEQYSPTRQSQGGDYVVDPQVEAYVNQVGQKLAAVSDRKLPYEFNVINSSVPNAWALPGGKISINRGLLVEMQSEAELAAVLGHEIVHAAARHGAQGAQRGMLLQGGILAASIATAGSQYANLAQIGASIGAQLINTKYGRDAERESDHYGMTYMSRAGYDPQGAVDLQKTFVKLSEGRRQDFLSGLFASHPPSQERVENNTQDAANLPTGGVVGKSEYQQKLATLFKTKPAYDAYDEAQKALTDGNNSKAKSLAQKAIKLEPREGHFHSLMGDIEQKNNKLQTARTHYDKAISLNNNFFYYFLQNGLVSERLGDQAAAKRYLDRSLQLLPTANAYNSLGNIARAQGQINSAKQYYSKAAGQKNEAGQAAFGSLVELDLPTNPGKYLQTRYGVAKNGQLQIQVNNATPRNVRNIVVAVQYVDVNGKLRNIQQKLSGGLAAGKSQVINTNVRVNTEYASRTRVAVVAAALAN